MVIPIHKMMYQGYSCHCCKPLEKKYYKKQLRSKLKKLLRKEIKDV